MTNCAIGVAVDEAATVAIAHNDISFNQIAITMFGRGTIRDNVLWGNLGEAIELPPEVQACSSCCTVRYLAAASLAREMLNIGMLQCQCNHWSSGPFMQLFRHACCLLSLF